MEFIGCDKITSSFSHSAFVQNMKQAWYCVTGSGKSTNFSHGTPVTKLAVKVEVDQEQVNRKQHLEVSLKGGNL